MFRKLFSALIFSATVFSVGASNSNERIVILHTNDTHSIIDPYSENGLGGVARRKVLIDSVRSAEPNVLLVDAGDVVQGSLYFTLFSGEVEQKVMNALEYDIQILGNHEFDNGMASLKKYLDGLNADLLTTNYDLTDTEIKDDFKPYVIKKVGGKRIGFMGINVEPHGLIDSVKSQGVRYIDAIKAANAMAWYLKNVEHCDYVVAVSHIGYDETGAASDCLLAQKTENIDLVIGGHSHTKINPADPNGKQSRFINLVGDTVVVAQTGKYGANLGMVVIDGTGIHSSLIPVDQRLDKSVDKELLTMLAPYKHPVDSICNIKIGKTSKAMGKRPELMNWMADFVNDYAQTLTNKKIDLALVNVGGIRSTFPKGYVTKGMIMQTFPFDNYIVVLELSGEQLAATLDSISAHGGNGVSRQVDVTMDIKGRRCKTATINGLPIEADRTYYVATINYLAGGNDGMDPLKYGKVIASSKNYLYDDMINSFERGFLHNKSIKPDYTVRMHE